MNLSQFIREKLGTDRWMVGRRTPRLAIRIDKFLTPEEHAALVDEWARTYPQEAGTLHPSKRLATAT